jgi:DNA modification methylase
MDRRVKLVQLGKIRPSPRNPRTHTEAQVAQIVASIQEWGWTNPLLVDEDYRLVTGHGRLLAAQVLGLKTVPTLMASGWTEAQKRAYVIADNKLALNAGWDMEFLKLEIDDIAAADFDVDLLGFTGSELQALESRKVGLTDPDQVPDLPDVPVAQLGDVWLLGPHRLVCGDATDPLHVELALSGVKPHLMVTDPPYGVNYDPTHRRALQSANCQPAQGAVNNDNQADWTDAWGLFPGSVAYVWHAGNKAHVVAESLIANGFQIRAQVVWAKSKFVVGRGDYHPHHEPCWYVVKKGSTGHWNGSRKESTLWHIEHRKSETGHSAQKPIECMLRPIENNSSPGQAVYDPFVGSGTTIIAAEITGRICHAIEINPAYVDVAVKRWQDFTGEISIKEGTNVETKTNASENRNWQPRQKATQQKRAQNGAGNSRSAHPVDAAGARGVE